MDKEKAKITILFPAEVHQTLKELAQIDERSFNGEVVWILRDYIARRKGANCEFSLGKKNDEKM